MLDDKIFESEIYEMVKLICKVFVYNVYDDDVFISYIDNIVICNKELIYFGIWVRYYVMGIKN